MENGKGERRGGEGREERREDGRNDLVVCWNRRKKDRKRRAGITIEIEIEIEIDRIKVISENKNEAPFD